MLWCELLLALCDDADTYNLERPCHSAQVIAQNP